MPKEKTYLCLCLDCGGQRQLIGNCRLCDSTQTPEAITETLIFNMELGYPTIEEAIDKFETYLDAAYDAGFKSMIVILIKCSRYRMVNSLQIIELATFM